MLLFVPSNPFLILFFEYPVYSVCIANFLGKCHKHHFWFNRKSHDYEIICQKYIRNHSNSNQNLNTIGAVLLIIILMDRHCGTLYIFLNQLMRMCWIFIALNLRSCRVECWKNITRVHGSQYLQTIIKHFGNQF